MSDRTDFLASAKTIVIKLGTQSLSDKDGRLDNAFISSIAAQVATLRQRGLRVTIVSSGAIGCGIGELKLPRRPTDLAMLQAVAAIGQRRLMDVWAAAFVPHHLHVAQILVTRQDIDDRARFLNLRNTIAAVHHLSGVPIVNENDTVSTAELVKITFGDNDILAATVAHALRANLLILLSVVNGLLDEDGKTVSQVKNVAAAKHLVKQEKSALGKGGMDSKLQAARMLTDAGEALVVADGRMNDVLTRIMDGEEIGTFFSPQHGKRSSKSRWIGSVRPAGTVTIDNGARKALVEQNRSLLPAGIVKVEGEFSRGDVIGILSADGAIIAQGLSNYSSADMNRIRGLKTADVRKLLAEAAYDEAIHRDNLAIHQSGEKAED